MINHPAMPFNPYWGRGDCGDPDCSNEHQSKAQRAFDEGAEKTFRCMVKWLGDWCMEHKFHGDVGTRLHRHCPDCFEELWRTAKQDMDEIIW